MIRNDNCPFGLMIPIACKCAGSFTEKMKPVSENEKAGETNRKILRMLVSSTSKELQGCKYVGAIIGKSVECNAEDSAPGVHPINFNGVEPKSTVMNGTSPDGLITFPEGWLTDSNLSRNSYYGQFSLQGSAKYASDESSRGGAGFAIYCVDDNTIFLMLRDDGRWGTPGGKTNGNEFPLQTAIREAGEEVGNLPDLRPVDYVEKDNGEKTSVTFVCEISKEAKKQWEPKLNKEHRKWKWFDIDDLPEEMHPAAERGVAKIRAITGISKEQEGI